MPLPPERSSALLIAVRGAWGAMLVLAPAKLTGTRGPSTEVTGARLLGVRHLAQAGLLARRPHAAPPGWSIAVDAAHGLSMVALAALSARFRAVALKSATGAFTLAGLSVYVRAKAPAVASSEASAVATSLG